MKKSIVIFSLLDTPAFGGAEQYLFSHLQYLNEQGLHITLATNNEKVKKEILSRLSIEEKKTFHVIHLPYRLDAIGNWKGLIKYFLGLPSAILWCYNTLQRLKKNYDKVICLWPGFSDRLSFSFITRRLQMPNLWIEIGPLEPTFKKTFGFPKLLYTLAERFPSHVITTSLFTKKSILRNTSFTEKDISLVYPGTKLFSQKALYQYKRKSIVWKKQKGFSEKICIAVVARLANENEIDMVLQAFAIFLSNQKNKKNNTMLIVVGDGPQRQELEALTEKLSITQQVFFTGFVTEEDKRTIVSACDFFIFPRAWELDGFGITTIEALSLGLPVLTSNFGPQIEIVSDGKEGFRYAPHDASDLAKHIEKMTKIGTRSRDLMKKAALKRVQEFSEKRSHQQMFSVVSSFFGEK